MTAVPADDPALIDRSVALAEQLLTGALTTRSTWGARRERQLRRVLTTPDGTRLVLNLADRVLRPVDPATGVAQLAALARADLAALRAIDRLLLRAAVPAGRLVPRPVMALVSARVRRATRHLVFPLEPRRLDRAVRRLRKAGSRPNLNLLGEAILGESEAERRTAATEALLARDGVDAVSIKVSSVAPSLSLLDFDGSAARVLERLRHLYQSASALFPPALVCLDMEEHQDLHLTLEVLRRVLEDPELERLEVGVALQAYLPDTHGIIDNLLAWAGQRSNRGGAGLRIRLVKGANLAMERVDAELHNWPAAPYRTKGESDASYLRLLDTLFQPRHAPWLRVGIATHNLFDLAYAIELANVRGMHHRVEAEMLAGMAEHQAASVARSLGRLLLYVPVVARQDFRTAIAYLARRLDENSTPEGFLRNSFDISVGSSAWETQKAMFRRAMTLSSTVRTTPYQAQDRSRTPPPAPAGPLDEAGFANEADTDLSVPNNRKWAIWSLTARADLATPVDATIADVERAVERAGRSQWTVTTIAHRRRVLGTVAHVLRQGRGLAIGVMSSETGKTFAEADPEVSEAIDYARWYARATRLLDDLTPEASMAPLGVVVVASPWNFPYAIPAGGTLASLAAGNAVILKPSPRARRVAATLVRQLHEAGVPENALQLVTTPDDEAGKRLATHPGVNALILTGSWETARTFALWRPDIRILAETSGKNAMVIGATADVDQAVRDVLRSAFSHAGQKCSAASLVIVHSSVHDRSPFLRQLADATASLRVGLATDPPTQVGPIVGPFTDRLERALTRLDPGESWLVAPRCLDERQRLWSPGVRVGVRPGSWAHTTEWFGPVLGVMRAPDLETALRWQNAVPFGLTAGLQSLDPAEQGAWADAVEAGNVYVNRPTTGALVGRQPFGGWKRSSFGPTAKTGGPNYLLTLGRWQDTAQDFGTVSLDRVERSYRRWWDEHFARPTEMAGLASEANTLLYRPLAEVIVRATPGADPDQVRRAVLAARISRTPITVSAPHPIESAGCQVAVEEAHQLASRLREGTRLRLIGRPEPSLLAAAATAGTSVCQDSVSACGRVELPRWLREKLVSRSRHRYGNLIG